MVLRVVEESGLSRAQLAKDARVSPAAIEAWVAGRREPSLASLEKLANGLNRRAWALGALSNDVRDLVEKADG